MVVESLLIENIHEKIQGWPHLLLSCALIFLAGCWENRDRFSAKLLSLDLGISFFEGFGDDFNMVQLLGTE